MRLYRTHKPFWKKELDKMPKKKDTFEKSKRLIITNKEKVFASNMNDTMTEAERKEGKEGEEEGKDEQMEDKTGEKGNHKTGEIALAGTKIDGLHRTPTIMEGENERNEKKSKTGGEEEVIENEQRLSFLAQEKAEGLYSR